MVGDAQGLILDKGVAGGVPGGIAPGLGGGPQPAGGEAGGVRLAYDQLLGPKTPKMAAPSLPGERNPSCFSAAHPVKGWNQWVLGGAFSTAQSSMAAATSSAMSASRGRLQRMVSLRAR